MKKSFYNLIVSHNENYLIYNTLYSSCVKLSQEEFFRFQNDTYSDEEKKCYKKLKLLVGDRVNEYNKVVNIKVEECSSYDEECTFTILPTTSCNASCYYCYEQGIHPQPMSEATANATIDFMISKLIETRAQKCSIIWFGGEPLLNTEIIDFITTRMVNFCKNESIKYACSMVSNGSLIDDAVLLKMKQEWLLSEIQITLDGTKDKYEQIKKLPINNAFDNIMNIIDKLSKAEIFVNIRINYSPQNLEDILCLLNYLSEKYSSNEFVHVYGKSIFTDGVSTSSDIDHINAEKRFTETLMACFPLQSISLNDFKRLLIPCGAAHKNTYVVNPNGHLVRCEHFVGDKNEKLGYIGTVEREEISFPVNWYSTNFSYECKNCKILPICMGGCIALRLKGDNKPCFRTIEQVELELKYYLINRL